MINPAWSPVPAQSTPQGGTRRYVREDALIINNAAGAYAATSASFKMSIPSVRLTPGVAVSFRPAGQEDTPFPPSGATAWMLTLDAWKRTSVGIYVRANNIVTNVPVPTVYENMDGTTVDEWRGKVVVPNSPGTGIIAGILYVIATWEPKQGDNISDAELAKLFSACNLSAAGITTSQAGV
jgi:hypothetical protein